MNAQGVSIPINMSRFSLFSTLGKFFAAFAIYRNERDIQALHDAQCDYSLCDLSDLAGECSDQEYLRKLGSRAGTSEPKNSK